VTDESGAQKLRRRIAERIKALLAPGRARE